MSFPNPFELSSLNGASWFYYRHRDYNSGKSISSAYDINDDEIDDLTIGAYIASPHSERHAGQSYMIFGAKNFSSPLESSSLHSVNGFMINEGKISDVDNDCAGSSVSNGGDINGDGYSDIIVGVWLASPLSRSTAGEVYIIFGDHISSFNSTIDLRSVVMPRGFKIIGASSQDQTGSSVRIGGDINNDGYDDIVIGACNASPFSRSGAGEVYVIFGNKREDFNSTMDLRNEASVSFTISGAATQDQAGYTVSSGGDINNDNHTDILVGSYRASPLGGFQAGESYVIYGFNQSEPPPPLPPSLNYIKEYVIPIAAGVAGAIVIGVAVFFGRKKYIEHQRGPLLLSSKESKVYSLQDQVSKHFSGAEKEPLSFNLIDQKKLEMVLSNGVLKALGEHTYTNPSTAKFVSNIYESLAYDKHMQQFLDLVGDILKGDSASEIIFDQPSSGYFNHTIAIKTDLSSASATKAVLMHELAHMLFERIANDLSQEASKAFEFAYEESLRLMERYKFELRSDNLKTPQQEYFLERMADYMVGLDNGRYSSGVKGCDELLARCVEMKVLNFTAEAIAFCGPIESIFTDYFILSSSVESFVINDGKVFSNSYSSNLSGEFLDKCDVN